MLSFNYIITFIHYLSTTRDFCINFPSVAQLLSNPDRMMAKDIEVSVFNETTLLVKDVTVDERFQKGNFGEVVSDIIYVCDTDETKTLQFATSFYEDECTQIYVLPSKSLQSDAKLKINWMYVYEKVENPSLVGTYTMNSDRFGHSDVHDFRDLRNQFSRADKSVLYRVEFLDGIKFDKSKDLFNFSAPLNDIFVTNKVEKQDRYDSGIGLDFTFVVDGTEIGASKYLLSASSDVFDAMLNNDWKDARDGRVDIHDVEPDVMDTFIRAIHGVEMKITDMTMAIKLMIVSDKYEVAPLQSLAATYVKKGIRVESVIEALVVSHQLGISDIREKCLRFIAKCRKPLHELTGWENVPQEVAVLIIKTLYEHRDPK